MMENKFKKYYNSILKKFKSQEKLKTIICKEKKINWPDSSGVYVIWSDENELEEKLLYVGMTGKFKRKKYNKKIFFNKGKFSKRRTRWSPYRFCESKEKDNIKQLFHFAYGPKKNVNEQAKVKYELEMYDSYISYKYLRIHCFLISNEHEEYTPELLEKEILTKYLKSSGDLPPANNEL